MNKKNFNIDHPNIGINKAGTGLDQPIKAIKKTRKKVTNIWDGPASIIQRIDNLTQLPGSRILQKGAFEAIGHSLRRGERGGTIKLPTGTGKTRVFAYILKAFQKNGIILVPRIDLYDSTALELRDAGFEDKNIRFLHTEDGGNTEERMLSLLTDPSIDWASGRIQCIMTYQALTGMVRKNPKMQDFMRSHFDIVIEDEAHRGLGDRTKEATDGIFHQSIDHINSIGENTIIDDFENSEITAISLENEANTILKGIKYKYKFTATPDLLGKSVEEDGEYIYYATIEDGVRTGAIILPQYINVGVAYTKNTNLEHWKTIDIEKLSEDDNFVDESGRSIRTKIIDAYLEKRDTHGSLLGVAFASTIEHARQIVEAMRLKGIKVERVTSATGDITSNEAINRMKNGELDIIVTVTKVSEGFNYEALGVALWFTPSLSPAKIFQGNGRIMRITDDKKPSDILDKNGKLYTSPNSYIIGPSAWYGVSSNFTIKNTEGGGDYQLNDEEIPKVNNIPRIGNFYEILISRGELNINAINQSTRDIINLNKNIQCELGEEINIDNTIYIGVAKNEEIMGINGAMLINNAKRDIPEKIIKGKQKSGYSINLIPKSFIEGLKIEYICDINQEIEINDIIYIGVTQSSEVMKINGDTLINNARRDIPEKIIKGKQKSGHTINLIPKSFIEGLKIEYICELHQEIEINDIIYIGIVNGKEFMGIRGTTIMVNAKKRIPEKVFKGKQLSGLGINLIPKSFIEGLLACTYEIGEEIEIDGIMYVGVTCKSGVMGVKGENITKNATKQIPEKIIQGKQKNGKNIQLIPKSFIELLKKE